MNWVKVKGIIDGIATGILKAFMVTFGFLFLFMFDTHRPRYRWWWR